MYRSLSAGGSGEAATTEKEFFPEWRLWMKVKPWLVCPGAKIWTPGLKEGLCWKNSRPSYAEIGQWDFFNLHLVLGRGSWKSTERNVSELNEGRGKKKKLNGSPLESWKELIQRVKWGLKSLRRRTFLTGLGGLHFTNMCKGVCAVVLLVSLWKLSWDPQNHPRGARKVVLF